MPGLLKKSWMTLTTPSNPKHIKVFSLFIFIVFLGLLVSHFFLSLLSIFLFLVFPPSSLLVQWFSPSISSPPYSFLSSSLPTLLSLPSLLILHFPCVSLVILYICLSAVIFLFDKLIFLLVFSQNFSENS